MTASVRRFGGLKSRGAVADRAVWEATGEEIHRFVGAMNRRDLDGATELFASEAVFHGGARFSEPVLGRAAIGAMFRAYFSAMEELRVEPISSFVAGNEAIAVMEITAAMGAQGGPMELVGSLPVKRRFAWRGAFRFTFDDSGHIEALRIYGGTEGPRWLPPIAHLGSGGTTGAPPRPADPA